MVSFPVGVRDGVKAGHEPESPDVTKGAEGLVVAQLWSKVMGRALQLEGARHVTAQGLCNAEICNFENLAEISGT